MDFYLGTRVLRVRFLRPAPGRRFASKTELLSERQVRHNKALDLLERRRELRKAGESTALLDQAIAGLGYVVQDEPDHAGDFRYSYWRK